MGRSSPTVAIQSSFLWANHYFIKFDCRDINAKLKLYAVIKIRAQFKTAQLAKFLLCRDILSLWWDKSSHVYDSNYFLYVL